MAILVATVVIHATAIAGYPAMIGGRRFLFTDGPYQDRQSCLPELTAKPHAQ